MSLTRLAPLRALTALLLLATGLTVAASPTVAEETSPVEVVTDWPEWFEDLPLPVGQVTSVPLTATYGRNPDPASGLDVVVQVADTVTGEAHTVTVTTGPDGTVDVPVRAYPHTTAVTGLATVDPGYTVWDSGNGTYPVVNEITTGRIVFVGGAPRALEQGRNRVRVRVLDAAGNVVPNVRLFAASYQPGRTWGVARSTGDNGTAPVVVWGGACRTVVRFNTRSVPSSLLATRGFAMVGAVTGTVRQTAARRWAIRATVTPGANAACGSNPDKTSLSAVRVLLQRRTATGWSTVARRRAVDGTDTVRFTDLRRGTYRLRTPRVLENAPGRRLERTAAVSGLLRAR